ncbi:MAG: carbohydrate ABC transporter permease [Spirochaetia bacterium]|nr:carbohydrate ABC transporter permease [Spirochaetia bacterium]
MAILFTKRRTITMVHGKHLLWRKLEFIFITVFVCALSFFPVVWIGLSSIKLPNQLYVFPISWIPKPPTLQHYISVFTTQPFGNQMLNSSWVSSWSTVLTVFMASLAGYVLSRLRFRGREVILVFILASGMIPVLARLIPLFSTMRKLGLLNSWLGLVLVYSSLALPLGTMTMMAYFSQIPKDLEQAAAIDGCSRLGALWQIIVPLAAPGMVTAALLSFIVAWNDFIIAVVLISNPRMYTIPVGISLFPGEFDFPWGTISAAVIVAVIPIVITILFFQKRIVAGLTQGAVKG